MQKSAEQVKGRLLGTIVIIAILVIVLLSTLPIVFFYVNTNTPEVILLTIASCIMFKSTHAQIMDDSPLNSSNQCASPVSYTGSVCRDELLSMTQCFPESSQMPEILVVSDSSAQAEVLLGGLQAFGSAECVAAATTFLCVHVFQGVCDENGSHYFPTAGECEELNSGACQAEFERSRSIGMEIVDCTVLPRDSPFLQCPNGSQEVVMPEENGMLFFRPIFLVYTEIVLLCHNII